MPSDLPSLKSKLPLTTRVGVAQWSYGGPSLTVSLRRWTNSIEIPRSIPAENILKNAPRRLVFRDEHAVIKAFPLSGARRWTGQRRYAHSESAHLIAAAARGIPVPECLAFGERRAWGGCRWNAVAQERIDAPTLRDRWLEDPQSTDVPATLEQLTSLAGLLYKRGVNHIDFGPHAIIMERDRFVVIDWQYAAFLPEPDPLVFASQIGYFAWSTATNRQWAALEDFRHWLDRLWDTHAIPKRDDAIKVFEKTAAQRFSIAERLNAHRTFSG